MWTRPLRELTPETSYGFAVDVFARDVLLEPLDPWEQWLAIHMCELLPDGRPRFRQVLVIVARQNGKTHLARVLTLFWMFVQKWLHILGVSLDRNAARKQLDYVYGYITRHQSLFAFMPTTGNKGKNKVTGQEALSTIDGSNYAIGAPNSSAGRGDSLDRVLNDELREQRTWDVYNAAIRAMNARPYGQAVFITNQGDEKAVVLHALRTQAKEFIDTNEGDETLGLFEWSVPGDPSEIDVMDPRNWAMANPNLGRRLQVSVIRSQALLATRGDRERADFLTEVLCVRVKVIDPAVSGLAWSRSFVPGHINLAGEQVAMCADIAPGGAHAILVGAAVQGDRVRVEVMKEWEGANATREMIRDLPGILERHKPKAFGWFPLGPAASLAADLKDRSAKGRHGWPPRGVTVEEIRAEVSSVCMGFALAVKNDQIAHDNEETLNDHVTGASKLGMGNDTWRFSRKDGTGYCDGAYAAAGAVHLVKTLPTPVGKPSLTRLK